MTHRLAWLASFAAAALAFGGVDSARAAQTNAEKCQLKRVKAAAKYESCVQKVLTLTGDSNDEDVPLGKCRQRYGAAYAKLQKLTDSSCAHARLVDNGDGTVTDNLTGLQWERKTDDGTIHDWDNAYLWSATGTAADGAAFGSFAAGLNNSTCFAGHCDWRVPTLAELGTLLLPEPFPCETSPCTDPVLGLVVTDFCYWSSSSAFHDPSSAWDMCFSTGHARPNPKSLPAYLRAVRGGL
jgi:hypothetical protein